jgi:hypothetical protein
MPRGGDRAAARAFIGARIRTEDHGFGTPCWIWKLGLTDRGYGDSRWDGRNTRTHRIAYFGFVGPIPEGLVIDHLCRVRSCCNPAHLEAVTQFENVARGQAGAMPTHCPRGHQLSDDNLIRWKGQRSRCRTCNLAWRAEHDDARARQRLYRKKKVATRINRRGGAATGSDHDSHNAHAMTLTHCGGC